MEAAVLNAVLFNTLFDITFTKSVLKGQEGQEDRSQVFTHSTFARRHENILFATTTDRKQQGAVSSLQL